EPQYLPPEQRSAALRKGMNIGVEADSFAMGEGSLLSTEVGGAIHIGADSDIAGTILAPAGGILLRGNALHLASTGRLLAPGVALITWHGLNSDGRELVDGEIYDGGSIDLSANAITLDAGAELDVSGVSATFDLQQVSPTGAITRRPMTLASN